MDGVVRLQQSGLDRFHRHKPTGNRPVDERTGTAPTVGIGVKDLVPLDQLPFSLEAVQNVLVAIFDEPALIIGHLAGEFTLGVDGADGADARALEHRIVILTEPRRGVDDARAIAVRDVVADKHGEGTVFGLVGKKREQRLVPQAAEFRTFLGPDDFDRVHVFVIPAEATLGQNEKRGSVLDLDVLHLRTDRERDVGGESPRSGGPGEEEGVGLALDGKLDGHRRVVHVLVATQVEFVGGQHRGAPRAIRHDLMAFVHQTPVVQGLLYPPDRLHEIGVHGLVVVVKVHPAPGTGHDRPPFPGVA